MLIAIKVRIRSPLTCETDVLVFVRNCYGRDLARGTKVNMLVKQLVLWLRNLSVSREHSLTMRTFHIGGAAQRGAEQVIL